MNTLIPLWILGAPFVGLLIVSFAFKGPSAMGGTLPRVRPGDPLRVATPAPLLDPMHPEAPRRLI